MTDQDNKQDANSASQQLQQAWQVFASKMEALRQERLKILSDLDIRLTNKKKKGK